MKEIITPFGIIYIEELNPAKREEEERIKVYDTLGKYIDYHPAEFFNNNTYGYNNLCEHYKNVESIHNIFPNNIILATKSWTEMYIYMLANDYFDEEDKQKMSHSILKEDLTDDILISHDYINVVGEFYILIDER